MATIPAILKGDTATAISVTAPEALATLTVKAAGVTRTFTDVAASATLSLAYTADETSTMPLGTWPMVFTGVTSAGAVKHYPITAKLKVTDCPGEVYNAPVVVSGGAYIKTQTVGVVGDGSTMKELRQTVNQLARIVSGTATAILAAFVLVAGAASKLEDIPGTNTVYTATETDAAIATAVTAAGSVTPQIATNISSKVTSNVVTKAFVEALGITGGGGFVKTNGATVVNDDFRLQYNPGITLQSGSSSGTDIIWKTSGANFWNFGGAADQAESLCYHVTEASLLSFGIYYDSYTGDWKLSSENSEGVVATVDDIADAVSPISSTVSAITSTQAVDHATISAWQTYWDGDDVRLTVTNYYGSSGFPHLYLEEKMATNETHTSTWFRVVWDEMSRWTNFSAGYSTFTNNAIQNYADRAWGSYDSSTGEYSPEDTLQISHPNIMIAAGLAYQKTVAANGGAVWVLTATDPTLVGGQTENGFLNITDGDGNSLMRIVKGDRRTVGATATAIDVQSGAVKVAYSCVADEHPILQASTNLTETFSTESSGAISVGGQSATVAWTGTSGAYTGTVTFASMPSSAFFRATYETGGETYISNSAPISVSSGILCTDGIHKCRPVYSNGSITWEVVQ